MLISAYFRTLNEEKKIERAIKAAFQLASEVIVIDSGSTDNTVNIARNAGATVYEETWQGNGKQKRLAEEKCRHNWLIDLDADEVVTAELAKEVSHQFNQPDGLSENTVLAPKLITIDCFGHQWSKSNVAYRYKIYNKNFIRQPDSKSDDQFKVTKSMRCIKLQSKLLHYGIDDLKTFFTKQLNNHFYRASKKKPAWLLTTAVFLGLPFYFIKFYFFRGLIFQGRYGFIIACGRSFGQWCKYASLFEKAQKEASSTEAKYYEDRYE